MAASCLLGGAAALGLAHVAFLPPWEGFDEEAHYSSLQQIVDRHQLPRHGAARISQAVRDYAASAPIRYDTTGIVEAFTYRSFFEGADDVIARGRAVVHGPPAEARRYVPSDRRNWEAQHPPLYYVLLAPVYAVSRQLSWGMHLFVLRSISYLFAWLALALGVYTCARAFPLAGADTPDRGWLILGVAAWPILFPGWFPEMARLGNDSLSALLAALAWWSTVRALAGGPSLRYAGILGVILGLGWLTKAFFIPFTAGLLAFWCVRQWRRDGRSGVVRLVPHAVVVGGLIAAIAGWWYVGHWRTSGVLLPSNGLIRLQQAGGLVGGLREHFRLGALGRSIASFVVRFAWPSTWSLVRPSYVWLAPLGVLVLGAVVAYLFALRRVKVTEPEWLPAWFTVPLIAAFGYHMLVWIAHTGKGSGFGYYLHVLVAPLGLALGLAIGVCWRRSAGRALGTALTLYSLLFAIVISWAQVLLFAGVLSRSSMRFYEAPTGLPPLLGLPVALRRLTAIAFPMTGTIAWLVGGALIIAGLIAASRAAAALPPIADRAPDVRPRARLPAMKTPSERVGGRVLHGPPFESGASKIPGAPDSPLASIWYAPGMKTGPPGSLSSPDCSGILP